MAVDLDPGRVDEDKGADAWRAEQCHLRGDPATNGVPDHGDVIEIKAVEKCRVHAGESRHGVERVRPRSRTESRMRRRNHPSTAGDEQICESRHRLRTGAAVQEEEGMTLSAVGHGDVDGPDALNGQLLGGVGHCSASCFALALTMSASLAQHV